MSALHELRQRLAADFAAMFRRPPVEVEARWLDGLAAFEHRLYGDNPTAKPPRGILGGPSSEGSAPE